MKYANIIYYGKRTTNIGDVLLLLVVNELYKKIGINLKEVVRIPYEQLGGYDGEEVILPVTSAFMGYHDGDHITCFSTKIHPVFLCLCLTTNYLCDEDVDYLKKYSPIGCRDWLTYDLMNKYDIPAYISGCLSTVLRFEKKQERRTSTLLVDIPEEFKKYIPKEYSCNVKEYSQIVSIEDKETIECYAYERYIKYVEESDAVITSRLHCAIPMAMAGKTVFFVGEEFEGRFSWLEKYIKFWPRQKWDKIEWTGDNDIEGLKEISAKQEAYAISRIRNVAKYYEMKKQNETFFAKVTEYNIPYFEWLIDKVEKAINNYNIDTYVIWGIGQICDMIKEYMDSNHKDITFKGYFDIRVKKHQKLVVNTPDKIEESIKNLCIITPITIFENEKYEIEHRLCNRKIFLSDYCYKRC